MAEKPGDFADPVALTHRIDDLRDALAAVGEALNVPAGQVQERSDRAIIAKSAIRFMLMPGADIGVHIRGLREHIAERPAPGA